jgi:osmotically inducible lipoprotein OsmB
MRTAESFTLITSFALVLAACGDTPGKRALTGGAIGAVAGAVVGSAFGHSIGGALVGGFGGAAIGAATAPKQHYYPWVDD